MQNYHNLLQEILEQGVSQGNRTGINTLTIPGAMLKFDLREGFPAVTTKKLAFKQVVGELIGFLRGASSAAEFRELGCNIWGQNANENTNWLQNPNRDGPDDLGRIYGVNWRFWRRQKGWDTLDQIQMALEAVRHNPESRRILVSAWRPDEFDQMALPPCHVLFQLLPHIESKTLHMTMYQRSCDMFLGVPFNIASYALLLELFAKWTGYTAGTLTMFLADCHIYENHVEQVKEQLSREAFPTPKLWMAQALRRTDLDINELLKILQPECIDLGDYEHHPAIKAPMAV